MKTLMRALAWGLLCFGTEGVIAAPAASPTPAAPSPWRLGLAFGYGERSNPLIQSESIPVVVDLDIAWFGERLFFDNGDLGLELVDNKSLTLSLVGRVNSDRVFFGKTNARLVLVSATGAPLSQPVVLAPPDRAYAVELGVEALMDGRWGRLALSGFHDVSDAHHGFEVRAEYAYRFHGMRWAIEPLAALEYKSAALNDYYWGVRPAEANEALPAYQAESGVNWEVGARASYYLSRHLRLAASFNYERLNRSAAGSPLVTEQGVLGYFTGLAYQF
jgi:outer membrane protein